MNKDKRLFHICFPAARLDRDMYLPMNTPIHQINKAIGMLLRGLSGDRFISTSDTALYRASTGEPLDINSTIAILDIPSGEILLVV